MGAGREGREGAEHVLNEIACVAARATQANGERDERRLVLARELLETRDPRA
jgi:hypothetical protein